MEDAADRRLDPTPRELLLDRCAGLIDEVAEEIERSGQPPLSDTMDAVLEGVREKFSQGEWHAHDDAKQQAILTEFLRYRAEVQEPAAAIVRERKASQPSAVKKIEVACLFSGDRYEDAAFYREALDGIEPELEVADAAPAVSSMSLRMSWTPTFVLRGYPTVGFISSLTHNIMVLYVGPGRPGCGSPGFYLVHDSWAGSVSVVPRLPSRCVGLIYGSIGTGVAVLRHRAPSDYVLAELLLRRENGMSPTSDKADLFLWWSSGDRAGQWVEKSVALPLPPLPAEEADPSTRIAYSFRADAVLAAGRRRLCWIDLVQGVLVCDDVLSDACPPFRFVPLPEGRSVADLGPRGRPGDHRSACCVDDGEGGATLKFVAMDGLSFSSSSGATTSTNCSGVTLTTWSLSLGDDGEGSSSQWVKGPAAVSLEELLMENDHAELTGLMPLKPILSVAHEDVVYLSFGRVVPPPADVALDWMDEYIPAKQCVATLTLDLRRRRVLSAIDKSALSFPQPRCLLRDPVIVMSTTD